MNRCRQCNITISDDTIVCPLCRCVIDDPGEAGRVNEYPELRIKQRKIQLVSNLMLATVLISGIVLTGLDLAFHQGGSWCVIPIAAAIYAYLAFRMIFVSRKGYRVKVFIPIILAVGLLMIIDMGTGYYKWSLNYILPSAILVTDIIILMLMLTNLKNRYSYMIMQMIVIAVCIIPMILWGTGIIDSPLLTLIATIITVSLFLVTLMAGGREARRELKIRFHIK